MSLNLETEALASYNYLTELVGDEPGYTYFNVFRTAPAEAVHDWPDFLDVPARSAETCVLLRHMTGRRVATEDDFFSRILGYQEADGLFWRPETRITAHRVYEEETLVAAALVARAIADGDADAADRLARLVAGRARLGPPPGPFGGMGLRPLVAAAERLRIPGALELARRYADVIVREHPLFRADGSFAGHVHGHLYAAAGLCELGRVTGDETLCRLAHRVFVTIGARATSFGFVPELTEREDDVIGCETCCLMDFVHLGLAVARAGRPECYDVVERAVRNHLVESRVRHGDWLADDGEATDDELRLRRDLQRKVVGAYAGWSAPNCLLAYDEYLPEAWLKTPDLADIYLRRVRALQNCCGPSGPKALYLAWQHAARVTGGTLWVNLRLDRALPEAEIRCLEPHEGRLTVRLAAPLAVAVRAPERASFTVDGRPVTPRADGLCRVTEPLAAGSTVAMTWPLREWTERVTIGNAGRQRYRFDVRWRGATVMGVEPLDNPTVGRSHLMPGPTPLHYGPDGPHPIYQRQTLLADVPRPTPLHVGAGPDVW